MAELGTSAANAGHRQKRKTAKITQKRVFLNELIIHNQYRLTKPNKQGEE
jgi:hypothetical protein